MAEGSGQDVSEYLQQNPHLAHWVESLRELSETNKHWHARREFVLRNMEVFPTIQPGIVTPSLDRLLSLSKVWANQTFLGCRYVPCPVLSWLLLAYLFVCFFIAMSWFWLWLIVCFYCSYPQPVTDKVKELAEGIGVNKSPVQKTKDEIVGKGKRPFVSGVRTQQP